MFSSAIPNSATAFSLVETAMKWRATAASAPSAETHQRRAACAFASVSSVVNVFEHTTNSVSAGSRSRVASAKSFGSTLATKRTSSARGAAPRSAWLTMRGPRSEPPMPRFTTARIRRPL